MQPSLLPADVLVPCPAAAEQPPAPPSWRSGESRTSGHETSGVAPPPPPAPPDAAAVDREKPGQCARGSTKRCSRDIWDEFGARYTIHRLLHGKRYSNIVLGCDTSTTAPVIVKILRVHREPRDPLLLPRADEGCTRSASDGDAACDRCDSRASGTGSGYSDSVLGPFYEAELTRKLSEGHRGIVRALDTFASHREVILVLEHCEGGDLISKLDDGPRRGRGLPEADACRLFRQIVSALLYAKREHRVCHRDLKLDNVFLRIDPRDGSEEAVVGDWGFATPYIPGVGYARACGTRSYMAPEMFDAEEVPYDGAAADVWALGIMLYASMHGMMPFVCGGGDDTRHLQRNICALDIAARLAQDRRGQAWTGIAPLSLPLQALLTRMLDRDPESRIALEDVETHPWFQLWPGRDAIGGSGSRMPPARPLPSSRKRSSSLSLATASMTIDRASEADSDDRACPMH